MNIYENNNEIIVSAEFLLTELKTLLEENYPKGYEIKITKSDDMLSFCTEHFLLTFQYQDFHFYLTFMVGLTAKVISNDTRFILQILAHEEFTVLEDSYFDNESDKLVFGMEALALKQKEILTDQGKTKCNICDRIFYNDQITEKGICKHCNMDDILWN